MARNVRLLLLAIPARNSYAAVAGKRYVCLTDTQPNGTGNSLTYSLLRHERMTCAEACDIVTPLLCSPVKRKKSVLPKFHNIFSLAQKSDLIFLQSTYNFFLNHVLCTVIKSVFHCSFCSGYLNIYF